MIPPKVLSVREEWIGTPAMRAKLGEVIAKTAHDVQAQAAAGAPVDTGYLRSSIQAIQVDDLSWQVVVGAEYGIYVEMGTYKMAAQPYLEPAVELVRPGFDAAVAVVVNG